MKLMTENLVNYNKLNNINFNNNPIMTKKLSSNIVIWMILVKMKRK